MIHPDTELRHVNEYVGYGVFATAFIPKGTIVWVMDRLDRTFTEEEWNALPPVYLSIVDKYSYRNGKGFYIFSWDHGRFVNHSCEANCLTTCFDFEIAVRDISAGEELCDDYGMLNITESMPCSCGIPQCRGTIQASDMETMCVHWDGKIKSALAVARSVPQPLWPLIENPAEIEAACAHPEHTPSIRSIYLS